MKRIYVIINPAMTPFEDDGEEKWGETRATTPIGYLKRAHQLLPECFEKPARIIVYEYFQKHYRCVFDKFF